ncbi:hypothetical protein EMIT0P4_20053 [Pseudomonas sp. IT-P4]
MIGRTAGYFSPLGLTERETFSHDPGTDKEKYAQNYSYDYGDSWLIFKRSKPGTNSQKCTYRTATQACKKKQYTY